MKYLMFQNKKALSLIESHKPNYLDSNFCEKGNTTLARNPSITLDSILDKSPQRPISAGSEPRPQVSGEHVKQLDIFEKLMKFDYAHQLHMKEVYSKQ